MRFAPVFMISFLAACGTLTGGAAPLSNAARSPETCTMMMNGADERMSYAGTMGSVSGMWSAEYGPSDGKDCIGGFDAVDPQDAQEVDDQVLGEKALGDGGAGRLCKAKVYQALRPIKVYRAWNASKTYTEYGAWWAFGAPTGSKERYREENAICPEWTPLDKVSVCYIKAGQRFAIGPGQSVNCANNVAYAKSAVNQVFVDTNTQADASGKTWFQDCAQLPDPTW